MDINALLTKALDLQMLTAHEGVALFEHAGLPELMTVANLLRQKQVPGSKVTWQIDRNVNITNVCIAGCKFCNFHCGTRSSNAYITTLPEYKAKIDEMLRLGSEQLLLQGGLHPKLGLDFYTSLFRSIKTAYPNV